MKKEVKRTSFGKVALARVEIAKNEQTGKMRLAAVALAAAGLALVWRRRARTSTPPSDDAWVAALDAPTVAAARSSCRLPKESLMGMLEEKNDYAQVFPMYM